MQQQIFRRSLRAISILFMEFEGKSGKQQEERVRKTKIGLDKWRVCDKI